MGGRHRRGTRRPVPGWGGSAPKGWRHAHRHRRRPHQEGLAGGGRHRCHGGPRGWRGHPLVVHQGWSAHHLPQTAPTARPTGSASGVQPPPPQAQTQPPSEEGRRASQVPPLVSTGTHLPGGRRLMPPVWWRGVAGSRRPHQGWCPAQPDRLTRRSHRCCRRRRLCSHGVPCLPGRRAPHHPPRRWCPRGRAPCRHPPHPSRPLPRPTGPSRPAVTSPASPSPPPHHPAIVGATLTRAWRR